MAVRLSDATVKRLPLPDKNSRLHYDSDVVGFAARITAGGARSYVLRYRVRGSGRERTYTIGSTTNWQTTAARAEAKRLHRLIDQGGDPLADIKDAREAPTVADLIDRFLAEYVGPRLRSETTRNYRLLLENHVRPFFGVHIKVADVRFEDVDNLHRKISKTAPYAANRCHATLSKMFALAVRWNMRTDNPAKGIARNAEQKRERFLSAAELARLVAALATYPDRQVANIVRTLLLTGARCGEVFAMRWGDVDLGVGNWSKPAHLTKTKKAATVPLSAPVRQLLAEIQEAQKASLGTYVFPSYGAGGHVTTIEKAWWAICRTANISNLRLHDLRHSFASLLVSGGATLPLIGSLLGHSSPVTTARYSHLHDDPQRAAVERVGAIVEAAAGKDTGETVEFPEGARHGRR
jgi:integrase